jgi:osmoprotectant transport system substrate-binding protein
MRSPRKPRTIVAALVACLALAACGEEPPQAGGQGQPEAQGGAPPGQAIERNPANAGKSIVVGSKNFDEQLILGEIYAQALRAAGYNATTELNLGSEQIAFRALRQGEIGAYPEYTGTASTSFYQVPIPDVPKDPQAAYEQARDRLAEDQITALPPTPFENTYRIGTLREKQGQIGARTTSELTGKADQLTITGYPECRQREDCLVGVRKGYGLNFRDFVSSDSPYEVLDRGDADLAFMFTTDAQLKLPKYVTLEDDKNFFPPYNISLLVRDDKLRELGPDAREVVENIQSQMTEPVMIELNSRVTVDKQKPGDVARQYLQESGYIR